MHEGFAAAGINILVTLEEDSDAQTEGGIIIPGDSPLRRGSIVSVGADVKNRDRYYVDDKDVVEVAIFRRGSEVPVGPAGLCCVAAAAVLATEVVDRVED